MQFHDTIVCDALRRTDDGYLVATAKVARAGVQIYAGADVGKPDLGQVRVYRPEAEVFSKDALHSFAHRPVTIDHPSEMVTAENWREHAVGQTGDEIARDGEFIRVPLVLMDARAIKTVEDGRRRQLSMGYTCDVAFEPGTTPQGETYDAVQRNIRANHLAVVSAARGGPELKLGDEERTEIMADAIQTKTVIVDGLSVVTTDAGAQAIDKLQGALRAANDKALADMATANTKIAEQATAISTKDGEIAALKQKVADAELTPAKVDAAVADRAKVIDGAKRIAGDKLVTDGKSNADIMRAAVAAKIGDEAAKALDDAGVKGAFVVLVPAKGTRVDPLARVLGDVRQVTGDAEVTAYDKSVSHLNAWRTKAA